MKTERVTCGHCGQLWDKPCYDLDLKFGDKIMDESHVNEDYMKPYFITITDTTHKEDGLYFGNQLRIPHMHDLDMNFHVRVDTRNHKFVKI